MSHSPLVSVVIPLFNYERYVEECVNSALNQTHANVQIIVVNNASTDSGPERVSRINDPRLEMLHIDVNEGIGKALNIGFQAARGDWIAYLPADDYLEPDFICELLLVGQNENVGMVGCWMRAVDEHGQANTTAARMHEGRNNHPSFDITNHRQFRWSNPIAANTILWRAEVLAQCIPLHENLIPCDWGMLIRATSTGSRMETIGKKLINYRWHGGNLGARMSQRGYYIDYCFVHLVEYRDAAKKIIQNKPREIAECKREFISNLFKFVDEPDLICRLAAASATGYEASSYWPTPAKFKEWVETPVPEGDVRYAKLLRMAEMGVGMARNRKKMPHKMMWGVFRRMFQAKSASPHFVK